MNMFSKIKLQLGGKDKMSFNPKPQKVWASLLVVFGVLFLVSVVIHTYIYFYLQDIDKVLGPEDQSVILREADLERAVEIIIRRQDGAVENIETNNQEEAESDVLFEIDQEADF